MQPNKDLHYFRLYGLLFGTLAVIYMLYKWRGDKSMTLSLHAASHPGVYLTMGIVSTVTAIFICPFFGGGLYPLYNCRLYSAGVLELPAYVKSLLGGFQINQVD